MEEGRDLPDDIDIIPEPNLEEPQREKRDKVDVAKTNKGKWGSMLLEKRPRRRPQDDKKIMEKAQERKKRTNLEGMVGNNKSFNPFSILADVEITSLADAVYSRG
jgi:hypothetical protein